LDKHVSLFSQSRVEVKEGNGGGERGVAGRPTGVTILAVLAAIAGVLLLLMDEQECSIFQVGDELWQKKGVQETPQASACGSSVIGVFTIVVGAAAFGMSTGWLSGLRFLLTIVGGLMIIMSIILFLDSRGLYSGKRWSLYLTTIILVLSIISSLFTLMAAAVHSILSIIVDVLLLYYLTRPDIKVFFQV